MPEPAAPSSAPLRSPGNRVAQGGLFLAGAGLLEVTAGADRLPFYWTPLALGLTYLVAALIDGPTGGYWATALALTGWGLAVVVMGRLRPVGIDSAGAYLLGVGLAGVVAAILRVRGFAVSEPGFAATIAAAGAVLALTPRVDAFDDATTYALALGLVGVANLLFGTVSLHRERQMNTP